MLHHGERWNLTRIIEGYISDHGMLDSTRAIIDVLAMKKCIDEEAARKLIAEIDEIEPNWNSAAELREGTYKIWCTRRNSKGEIIRHMVFDTKYVRKAYALKYAQKTFGMSRPAFEYQISIECPWKLEVEVEE